MSRLEALLVAKTACRVALPMDVGRPDRTGAAGDQNGEEKGGENDLQTDTVSAPTGTMMKNGTGW